MRKAGNEERMNTNLPIRTLLAEPKTTEHVRNEEALRNHGKFSLVSCVDNGYSVLECMQKEEIDLVLMDLLMPQMDGLGVLHAMQDTPVEQRPVVILLTPVISELILKEAFRLGAIYAISKPFNPSDIAERVLNIYAIACNQDEDEKKAILIADDNMRPYIQDWLRKFEISPSILGYRFLLLAIEYYILYCEARPSITKEIYPYIANTQGTSPSNVERAIRHALHSTWDRADKKIWAGLLDREDYVRKNPSNGEFICISADKIIQQMREANVKLFFSK